MYDILKKVGLILLKLLGQKAAQGVILDLLGELTKRSDNTIDDKLVAVVRQSLENRKDTTDLKALLDQWTGGDESAP